MNKQQLIAWLGLTIDNAVMRGEGKSVQHLANVAMLELLTAPPAPDLAALPSCAEIFISAIEKEQDRLSTEDYLMDSKDCIDVIREEVLRRIEGGKC